jgi:hypothetical protein
MPAGWDTSITGQMSVFFSRDTFLAHSGRYAALASDLLEEAPQGGAGAPVAVPSNGFGGLTPDGDYEIQVAGDRLPPAPWANVIANPHGGFVVTERGGGFTWAENSYFYRLTPWHNDPVSDPVSDVVYLQDDETGELWSATPGPVRTEREFTVRHGAGKSTFTEEHGGIKTELTLGMADDAVNVVAKAPFCSAPCRAPAAPASDCISTTVGTLPQMFFSPSEAFSSAISPMLVDGVIG